jgi:hypothetical protein
MEVCIKEEDMYLGERGQVLVGLLQPLLPFFVQILTRTVEKYYVLIRHNCPLIAQVTYTFSPSFGGMYKGKGHILGRGRLVLVGLLQPPVPLFVQILTRTTVEKSFLLMAKTSRSLRE